ncbi:hypothetical protein EOI86_23070 [Hwanghaeella grinnelliae]|uniref:Uncharacterized protein n=1 Tax=Hwanghaeella grinnelliae TaxID=2500179 RepID=A0A3S2VMJ0_9PROT|nr:hypothetical protein [Hwanghaeella grinnelliae]RVU34006.1 hypothetical protein EOI86_23070 [Hwanghaeella grinnelliae]
MFQSSNGIGWPEKIEIKQWDVIGGKIRRKTPGEIRDQARRFGRFASIRSDLENGELPSQRRYLTEEAK